MAVTAEEYAWREWWLGEGRYAEHRPHDPTVRPMGVPRKVPAGWWQRLEAFLARRNDHFEKGKRPTVREKAAGKVIARVPARPGQLSEHFNVREFDCKDGRRVPATAVPALDRLCEKILEPLRAEFGLCTVVSGYRPVDYNRRIGGARYSQHIYELGPESVAADVVFERGNPMLWHRKADELGTGGLGLYSSFIHVDNRPVRARWVG